MRRRGEKESLTADGLWFTGCSGTKEKEAKRKCPTDTDIPAAHLPVCLPAAGARKRELFSKSSLLNFRKNFRAVVAGKVRAYFNTWYPNAAV